MWRRSYDRLHEETFEIKMRAAEAIDSSNSRVDHEMMSGRLGMINLGRLRRAVEDGLKSD